MGKHESALLGEWGTDEELRPEIAVSWWRSKLLGVRPELPIESVVPVDLIDAGEQLRRSLQPVLDDLATKLTGTNSAVLLADHRAVIIDRRGTTRQVDAALDSFAVMPGYDFGEGSIGTNGIGTAAEERRLVRVAGTEHYAAILRRFSCYGVPLVHPLTRRLVGVLDLTFPPHEEHPLMASFIADAGQRIEGLLVEWASSRQRAQFDCFLTLGRQRGRAVLSVMDEAVLLNRSARALDPVQQAELLRFAEETGEAAGGGELLLTLSGYDEPVSVRVHTQSGHVSFPGVVLELASHRNRRSGERRQTASLPALVGTSPAWAAFCSEALQVAAAGVPVLLVGAPGAGKLAAARALHEHSGRSNLVVADTATLPTDGQAAWLKTLRQGLGDPGCTVVIRHVERCEPSLAAAIAAEIDRSPSAASRLLAALTPGTPIPELEQLVHRFGVRLEVPALAQRRGDISVLAEALLRRHAAGASLRFHPSALAVLLKADFADNVRGLERVIVGIAARRRSGDIIAADLPPVGAGEDIAHLTPMERAERATIVEVLRAVHGNKAAAAATLGISRPTLYRKLRVYRIE